MAARQRQSRIHCCQEGVGQVIEKSKKLLIAVCLLATLSGCVAGPAASPRDDEQVPIDVNERAGARNIVITIGSILVLGAIIANEAGNNVEDALRDVGRP